MKVAWISDVWLTAIRPDGPGPLRFRRSALHLFMLPSLGGVMPPGAWSAPTGGRGFEVFAGVVEVTGAQLGLWISAAVSRGLTLEVWINPEAGTEVSNSARARVTPWLASRGISYAPPTSVTSFNLVEGVALEMQPRTLQDLLDRVAEKEAAR